MTIQSEPKLLTAEEVARRYPAVAVLVLRNGEAQRVHGQVVARTVAGEPRFDIRTLDGEVLRNVNPALVIDLTTSRAVQ